MKTKGAKVQNRLCTNKRIDISINQKNGCKGHCISEVQGAKHIYNICLHCTDSLHNRIDWKFFERWAVKKAIQFGMTDDWVDFVLLVVSKRVKAERS